MSALTKIVFNNSQSYIPSDRRRPFFTSFFMLIANAIWKDGLTRTKQSFVFFSVFRRSFNYFIGGHMSTNFHHYKCDRCNADALKHLDYGLLIEAALADGGRISAMPYIGDHLNLCSSHLNEANIKYVHYNEYEIGRCPSAYA